MRLTAIQSAGDAIDVTREYLFARSLRQAVILAFMVVFLGPTGAGAPPGPIELDERAFETDGEFPSLAELLEAIDTEVALAAIVLVTGFAVLYGLVSAFMEFGFIHSLVTDTAAIREPARRHWPRALALFAFRAFVWGTIALAVAAVVADQLGLVELPVATDWAVIAPILAVVGIAFYLTNRFTTDFVVPIMYHERRGLLGGWWRLLGVVRTQWRQYAVYLPVRLILEVALGIAFGLVIALMLLTLALVVGIPVGVVLVLLLGTGWGIALTLGLLALLSLALVAVALLPFHTYLRYYTLLVLGDTSGPLDLIAAKRATIRADR